MADYVVNSGHKEDRAIEYVDNLHEHFVSPVVMAAGRYWPPTASGLSAEMRSQSVTDHLYPSGPVWRHLDAMAAAAEPPPEQRQQPGTTTHAPSSPHLP